MAVNPEEERCERRGVDDTETVGLAGLERQGRVLVEADSGGHRAWVCTSNGAEVRAILCKVDQRRVYVTRLMSRPFVQSKVRYVY